MLFQLVECPNEMRGSRLDSQALQDARLVT